MSFYKTSTTEILAHRISTEQSFTKSAKFSKTASFFQSEGIKVDIKAALENVADVYKISKNPNDYIFVISRALTADVPNENHDAFPKEELLRFDTKFGCRIFQTFLNKPNHINHRADDPTQARGVILDAHYNDINPEDQFVEILVAVDTTKDRKLAEGIRSGNIHSMSMGCVAEVCKCSICGHEASVVEELCPDHIRGGKKGKEFDINGTKVKSYENCYRVAFQEESFVDEPADPKALVSEVLGIQAQLKEAEKKNRMEDESSILILSARLAKLESMIEDIKNAKIEVSVTKPDKLDTKSKFEDYKNKKEIEENRTMTSKEFGINPYATVKTSADSKMWKNTDKGGKEPAMWSALDKGKGTSPIGTDKDTVEVGDKSKYKDTTPNKWKKALLDKVALDSSAKEYWTKYFKDGYGSDLIKDIKRKKIGSTEKLSLEQMKVLEPKFASIMEQAKLDSIRVSTIFKFAEIISEGTDKVATEEYKRDVTKEKELKENIVVLDKDSVKEMNNEKWMRIESTIKEGDYSLDLLDDSKWYIVDSIGNKVASIFSKDTSEAFGSSLASMIIEKGLRATAEEYGAWIDDAFMEKVSLYPATGDPSLVKERDDDLRPAVDAPKDGVEEGGADDVAGLYRGDIKEEGGVSEDGDKDMPIKAFILKHAKMSFDDMLEEYVKELKAQGKTDKEIEEEIVNFKKTFSEGVLTPAYLASKEVESGVLEDSTRDIEDADKLQPEQTKGLLADSDDDVKDINRATTQSDKVYGEGQDDFVPKRDNVIVVGSTEFNKIISEKVDAELDSVAAAHAAKFKRAINLSIKRADLHLIDNEFKASLHDTLTSEATLPDGDAYTGMDDAMATFLTEKVFKEGSEKFISSMLKEAEKIMTLPEDVIIAWEEDMTNLNPINPMIMVSKEGQVPVNVKAKEAASGNPILKSVTASTESKDKFNNLSGLFGKSIVSDVMKKTFGR